MGEKPSCAGFSSFARGSPSGCHRAKARWFSGYPKTQLAADKTKRGLGGVLAADRSFPLAGAVAAAGENTGGCASGGQISSFSPSCPLFGLPFSLLLGYLACPLLGLAIRLSLGYLATLFACCLTC
ncbi:hypothetical protein FM107_03365 [Sphingobacterium sp. JB170]|nr:hypothetical protein FM107_03365 [Sphingobacterium sp. JB170]